jgi:hypothetical protein
VKQRRPPCRTSWYTACSHPRRGAFEGERGQAQ